MRTWDWILLALCAAWLSLFGYAAGHYTGALASAWQHEAETWSATAAWLFGGTGLVLNIVGLWAIYNQVKLSRVAAEGATAAAKAAMLDVRPWIKVDLESDCTFVRWGDVGDQEVAINFKLHNVGRTVATNVIYGCQLISVDDFRAFTPPSILPVLHLTIFPGLESGLQQTSTGPLTAIPSAKGLGCCTVVLWVSYGVEGAAYTSMVLIGANQVIATDEQILSSSTDVEFGRTQEIAQRFT